jgi:hypothetical protein
MEVVMSNELILSNSKLDSYRGMINRSASDLSELLNVALQAIHNGKTAVAIERISAAIDDLQDLKAKSENLYNK